MRKLLAVTILVIIISSFLTPLVLAATAPANMPPKKCGGTGQPKCPEGVEQPVKYTVPNWLAGSTTSPTGIIDLLDLVAKWILNISIPIAVALIIYGGILYMTGGVQPAKISKANNIFKQVAIGLSVIFIGKGFISLIKSILEIGSK